MGYSVTNCTNGSESLIGGRVADFNFGRGPGGGEVGTGIGCDAAGEDLAPPRPPRLRGVAGASPPDFRLDVVVSSAAALSPDRDRGVRVVLPDGVVVFCFDSRTARRLTGPRTGVRLTKTQPIGGTGLPPTRRPSSKSQSKVPWNSWNESFEKTLAPALSAICRMNASPRPIAPAGGVTRSPSRIACSKRALSDGSMR